MRSLLSTIIMMASFLVSNSQNLVKNGGFEDNPTCSEIVDNSATWVTLAGTPKIVSTCNSSSAFQAPFSAYGNQVPFESNSYLAMNFFAFTGERDFVGTKLVESMVPGETYSVSYWVSHADTARFCTDQINITLGVDSFVNMVPAGTTNRRTIGPATVIVEELGWVMLGREFTADSAYRFLDIGNGFDGINSTAIVCDSSNTFTQSDYFVDGLSIIRSMLPAPEPMPTDPSLIGRTNLLGQKIGKPSSGQIVIEVYEDRWGKRSYRKVVRQP